MASKDSILNYIKKRLSNSTNITEQRALFIMEALLESKDDFNIIYFKNLIAKGLRTIEETSEPVLFNLYKDVFEFIGK